MDTLRRKRKDEGFTLLEIVISLGLIAVALLVVFHLQAQNLDLQSEAQFMTIAKGLIQERMSLITSREKISEGTSTGEMGEDFPDFTYQEEISEVSELENLYKVRVGIILERENTRKDLWLETHLYREKI
ncbi:MAG: type II secretion system protein [Deltaproteobacteria bacterium]|nr:type II secretion system protein [Deltaproteobacteria bacterium]